MTNASDILVVEDDEDDFFLTQRVLRRFTSGRIVRVESGRAAIDYLYAQGAYTDRRRHPFPAIVFLDLKMDQGGGHEVLAALRERPVTPSPAVYVLTGSNEPKDREMVRASGVAAGYMVKPLSAAHLATIFGAALREG
jgi:CheY-like chemotaxis protein